MNQTSAIHRIKTRITLILNRMEKSVFNKLAAFVILCALWTVILYN